MKTKNLTTRFKSAFLLLTIICGSILTISLLLHISLYHLEILIFDFAQHHAFITAFICLLLTITTIKMYSSIHHKISNYKSTRFTYGRTRLRKKLKALEFKRKNSRYKLSIQDSLEVDKNEITQLTFNSFDVLPTKNDVIKRDLDLNYAMKLGNNLKHKVKIFFMDTKSRKHVETTIWQANDNHVSLKSGIVIPVKSIYKIEF